MTLVEYYGLGRLDYSGVRGGVARPTVLRGGGFPYDKTGEDGYGDRRGSDRGNASRSSGKAHGPPVPRDTKDEAAGTHQLIGRSQPGSGGGTIPGTSGGWSSGARRDNVNDMGDAELDRASHESEEFERVAEAFVSLRDVPSEPLGDSEPVSDVELDQLRAEFRRVSADVQKALADMEDRDVVRVIFDLDPDYAVDVFAKSGKESLLSTYGGWADGIAGD